MTVIAFALVSAVLIIGVLGMYTIVFSYGVARRVYLQFVKAFEALVSSVFSILGALLVWQIFL